MKRLGRLVIEHRTIGGTLHVLIHRDRWWRYRYVEHGCFLCRATNAYIAARWPYFGADAHKVRELVRRQDDQS